MPLPTPPRTKGDTSPGKKSKGKHSDKCLHTTAVCNNSSQVRSETVRHETIDINNSTKWEEMPIVNIQDTEPKKVTGPTKMFVLDTNVLMHDPMSLFRFQEHDVYLPMITLEELDGHKRGMTEVARNVRQVTRSIGVLTSKTASQHPDTMAKGFPLNASGNLEARGRLFFQTNLGAVSLPVGLPDGKADNQILGVVQALRALEPKREILLVSKDINMRIKCCALGIPSEDYQNDKVLEDTDVLYTGAMELPKHFWDMPSVRIETRRTSDRRMRYSVVGDICDAMLVNQYVHHHHDGKSFDGVVCEVSSGIAEIEVLRQFASKDSSVMGITARNREQNFALNMLMNPECDFVTIAGKSGSGKTLLTLASALAQVVYDRRYSEIIITRATVPVGEDIGFLPGNEEEKMGPWMGAFEDNLEVLLEDENAHKTNAMRAGSKGLRDYIKLKSMNYMRGRTFLNKFVIVDEVQNLTPKQAKTIITRAGPGTKMVFLGNLAQIDTPYLTEGSSGLTTVVDRFKGWEHGAHITLIDCVRSRLAGHAEDVL